jgi:hypothetical protein
MRSATELPRRPGMITARIAVFTRKTMPSTTVVRVSTLPTCEPNSDSPMLAPKVSPAPWLLVFCSRITATNRIFPPVLVRLHHDVVESAAGGVFLDMARNANLRQQPLALDGKTLDSRDLPSEVLRARLRQEDSRGGAGGQFPLFEDVSLPASPYPAIPAREVQA